MQNMMARCRTFFGKPFFSDYRTLLALWMIIAVIGIKSIGHARVTTTLSLSMSSGMW